MVLDELKLSSDDASFTEDHVAFLLSKYRAMLIKQRYSDIRRPIPDSNYQSICLDLIEVPAMSGDLCSTGYYLRSKDKIPTIMKVSKPQVTTVDFFSGDITYISRERMRYVGNNKYLKNVIYASLGPDNYLYLTSSNAQFLNLERIKVTGIFENPEDIKDLLCEEDNNCEVICDKMDMTFPLEESLIPQVIQLTVKELAGPSWKPEDSENNASDDLANLANFIARNAKSALQKKMQE